jgi:anthranilate phosphoribosyltransferase
LVHGSDGLDELTTTGPSRVAALENGKVTTFDVSPADAGIAIARPEDLKGGDAEFNAAAMRAMLAGDAGPYRDIVAYTAGAALIVAGRAADIAEGTGLAMAAIDGGRARAALDAMVRITNEENAAGDASDRDAKADG